MEHLVIIGAGGYAKSVLDSVDYYNYRIEGFLDEFTKESEHLGYPVVAGSLEEIKDKKRMCYFVAIGNNRNRKRWYDELKKQGLRLINVVDRSAIVSPSAKIGSGCFLGKMSVVNGMSQIGDNCIINTKALVEHGCMVESHVNLSTNAVINGDVKIGEGSFIGSSSVTLGQLRVGKWSTVGAGTVVTKDVADNVTVVGTPARVIKNEVMLG